MGLMHINELAARARVAFRHSISLAKKDTSFQYDMAVTHLLRCVVHRHDVTLCKLRPVEPQLVAVPAVNQTIRMVDLLVLR